MEIQIGETIAQVQLVQANGYVKLVAVGSNGEPMPKGNLLLIDENGVWLCSRVSPSLGFPLDEYGQLNILNCGRKV